jgi:hypothetical protein
MDPKPLSKLKIYTKLAYEKGYMINNDGLLFSPKGKQMSPSYHKKGKLMYARFTFKGQRVYYHHLAAYQVYGNIWLDSRLLVRHLDGDSTNNKLSNISLGNHRDNTMDIPSENRKRDLTGAHNARRKFSENQVRFIREEYKNKSYGQIARENGWKRSTVKAIANGTNYGHVK